MTHRPARAPNDVDIERPSPARVYDYFLGGSHNFAADRQLAEEYMRVLPDMPAISRANRAFLRRAVSVLVAEAGIDQFLDLGSGLPSRGNVHEAAQALNPDARVVYVDSDPVTVAHAKTMLDDVPNADILHADLREPSAILESEEVAGRLDLTRPIAVLMVAVLHFVAAADDPAGLVAAYREVSAPGSYLVLSHATNEYHPETAREAESVYSRASSGMNFRSRAQISQLLTGHELLPPGLTDVIAWRPGPPAAGCGDPLGGDVTRYNLLAAVGRRT
jgi:hypothetical protein